MVCPYNLAHGHATARHGMPLQMRDRIVDRGGLLVKVINL